jgi:cell division protein FtsW (lipid II flippase)
VQCTRAGVPDQMQSDYVSFALLSLWGPLATLLILTGLLLWLWELMRQGPETHTLAMNFALLRQWIVTGFAVTSAVQIVISTAGTLGKMPLTGLSIPMLSMGGAGLLSTALFAGLSVNRLYLHDRESRQRLAPL